MKFYPYKKGGRKSLSHAEWGGGGCKKFPPWGGGREKFYRVLRGGGGGFDVLGTRLSHFVALPVINDQSLSHTYIFHAVCNIQ